MPLVTIETQLSQQEVERAISFLLKERERVRLQGQRRRERIRNSKPPVVKEPTEPIQKQKKSYYVPTGKPRGRPRKNPPADEEAPFESPADPK